MSIQSRFLAVLFALPFALSVPQSGPELACNTDPLTITNFFHAAAAVGNALGTEVSFNVTSPDNGTTPQFWCSALAVGHPVPGTCINGGTFTFASTPGQGVLTLTIPRNCSTG